MKAWLKKLRKYERIYCFPNRFGFIGFGLFLVFLAAGGTYQNNLIFMMAFLYLSLGLIAILQTARNIRDVEVADIRIESNFPSSQAEVRAIIKNNSPDLKLQIELRLQLGSEKFRALASSIPGKGYAEVYGTLTLPKSRGIYQPKRVGLYTHFPYSLFTAWKTTKDRADAIVYPSPRGKELDQNQLKIVGEDFSGHKAYEPGDRPSRIDWKALARGAGTQIREFKDGGETELQLDWQKTAGLDFEDRLSQMSRWILAAESHATQYDVVLPGFHSGSGRGKSHFTKCMEALTRMN